MTEQEDKVLTIHLNDGSKQKVKLRAEFFMDRFKRLSKEDRVKKLHSVCRDYTRSQYTHYEVT